MLRILKLTFSVTWKFLLLLAAYLKVHTIFTIPVFITDLFVMWLKSANSNAFTYQQKRSRLNTRLRQLSIRVVQLENKSKPNYVQRSWNLALQLSNRSSWSSATEKGTDSLTVWLTPMLRLSNYLLTDHVSGHHQRCFFK